MKNNNFGIVQQLVVGIFATFGDLEAPSLDFVISENREYLMTEINHIDVTIVTTSRINLLDFYNLFL